MGVLPLENVLVEKYIRDFHLLDSNSFEIAPGSTILYCKRLTGSLDFAEIKNSLYAKILSGKIVSFKGNIYLLKIEAVAVPYDTIYTILLNPL